MRKPCYIVRVNIKVLSVRIGVREGLSLGISDWIDVMRFLGKIDTDWYISIFELEKNGYACLGILV